MKRNTRILLALCPLAASMTLACGGSDELETEALDMGADAQPRVERVELTRLELTSVDAPSMLHPVKVEVELDVKGDAFDGDILVGLSADDGELGCVLGSLPVVHDESGSERIAMGSEMFVKGDCADMIDREDVELFVSFDPWGELEYERGGTQVDEPTGLYDVARGSVLGTEDCEGCRVDTSLADSPGLDAQLREVNLHSSVAVLSLPASADQVEMPADNAPHFSISTRSRVTGLARGQAPRDGEVSMRHRIRPLMGASGTEGLDGQELGWAPLLERRKGDDGVEGYHERMALDLRGQSPLQRASVVYIGDEVAARMGAGNWHDVEEFELEVCVDTNFDQAVFSGDIAPRDNDCAILPVVVIRDHVAADGSRGIESVDELAGGGKARSALTWGTGWQTTSNFAGTDYINGINFDMWLDVNSSDVATTTHGGRAVTSAGSWFEAGAQSIATVFSNNVTLMDAYVTAIGYNNVGGGIEAKVQVLGSDIIDTGYIGSSDGVELTLRQILDASGLSSVPTTWSTEYTLYGFSFDDGCSTVTAGIFLKGEIGLDDEETKLTIDGTANGVQVSGTIAPMAAILAEARAEAAYDGFLSINVALTMAIDILRITLPFTATATVTVGSPSTLALTQDANLTLSSLAGTIDFAFNYDFPCVEWPWEDQRCQGSHNHNLATWDGISQTWPLFSLSQNFQFGAGITPAGGDFCSQYDNQTIKLKTYHNKYMTALEGAQGWWMTAFPVADAWEHFTVQCQPDGRVAFQTAHGRYVQALDAASGDWGSQQTFIGGWEQFTPIQQNNGTWAFQTFHGKYLQALDSGLGNWIKQQTFVGGWEQFTVEL